MNKPGSSLGATETHCIIDVESIATELGQFGREAAHLVALQDQLEAALSTGQIDVGLLEKVDRRLAIHQQKVAKSVAQLDQAITRLEGVRRT